MASIYLRKNSKYYWIRYYEDGKPVQYSLRTKDKKVARYKKNEIENQLARGDSPLPDETKTSYHILTEYAEYCRLRNKHRTIQNDVHRINEFFKTSGINRLKQINEQKLHAYLDTRIREDKIRPATCNRILTNLKTFLNFCVRRNYLPYNPVISVKKFPEDREAPRFLRRSEIRDILKSAKNEQLYPMIACAIYSGLRFSELVDLTWDCIDSTGDTIMVRKSKSRKFRAVPLHPELKKLLKPLKADGRCFKTANHRRIFKRIKKRAGLEDIGWHSFRHTFASHLVMAGVPLVTVSEFLGHSSITTTMIYAHLTPDHRADAIKKINF